MAAAELGGQRFFDARQDAAAVLRAQQRHTCPQTRRHRHLDTSEVENRLNLVSPDFSKITNSDSMIIHTAENAYKNQVI